MSKTIDDKVVEMRFENSQFERNAANSISTLAKLKQSLNLTGASKGLEEVNAAAGRVDMNGLGSGVSAVTAKFSALQVMGVTALANIANSAVNAGKKMISALTIDPVKSGFQEYETQINAIQTILANTQKEGTNVKIVNKALDELNTYADKTIYNFTEMTRNIGTFTAAGVKLNDSVSAIQGIANLAAVSGSTSQQASTAMYQLSQALASGTVKLMDWNSVVNAGMGGKVFQDALIRTAEHLKTGAKAAIAAKGSFRESLSTGWLTTEVLTQTLDQFATAADTREEYEAAVKKFVEQGYTQEEAKQMADMAKTAGEAATKVKTFTQLIDTLKEAVGSGWTQTWRLIIGDFEEAKELWTGISDVLGGFINKMSDARNNLLESALDTGFTSLSDKLLKIVEPAKKASETIEKTVVKVADLGETADKLGIPLNEFIDNMDKITGRWLLINSFKNIGSGLIGVFKAIGKAWGDTFEKIKPEQLFNVIAAFHKFTTNLRLTDKKTGELNENGKKLVRTFKGIFAIISLVSDIVGGGLKIAFKLVSTILKYFDLNILDVTASIGDALVKFREMTNISKLFSKALEFIIPILKSGASTAKDWIDLFLDLPKVQEFISKLKESFDKLQDLDFKDIGKNIIDGFKNGFRNGIEGIIDNVIDLGKKILEAIKGVLGIHSPSTEFFDIGKNCILGFVNGIQNGSKMVLSALQDLAKKAIDLFNSINWGSLFAIGIGAGMIFTIKKIYDAIEIFSGPMEAITGILESVGKVVNTFAKIEKAFAGMMKSISLNFKAKAFKQMAIAIAILAGSVIALAYASEYYNLWEAVGMISALAAILVALSFAAEKISKASVSVGRDGAQINGLKTGLLAIAGTLLILAYTVKTLGKLDTREAIQGFIGLAGLVTAVGIVFLAYGKLVKGKAAQNIDKAGVMLMKLSVSLLLLVWVSKLITGMEWADMGKAAVGLLGLTGFIALLMTISMIPGKNISKIGSMLLKISIALVALVIVAKMIARMEWADMGKAAVGLAGLIGFIAILMTISMIPGKNLDKLGSTLFGISGAMLLLTITAKLIAGMEWSEMGKAAVGLMGLTTIVRMLIAIVKMVGSDAPKIAGTILAISVSIGILAGVAILLSIIDLKGLAKGIIAVGYLSSFMALMIVATRGASECKGNLIVMAIAIAVMTAAVAALSLIDTSKLASATIALSMLMGMFALMAKAAGSAKGAVGSLIVMTVAVGLMAGMLYMLSKLEVNNVLETTASLSVLLLAVTASLGILSLIGPLGKEALIGILALTAMTVPMLAFVGVLALMSNISNATENAKLLAGLMTVMTILLVPLSIIGALVGASGGIILLGIVALLAMAVPMVAFVGVLALINNIENASANAKLLTDLMTIMTDLLIKVSLVAPLAVIGVTALAALSALMVGLGILAAGIGALVTQFPILQTFIDTGIPILVKLANGVGLIVGSLVAGFATAVATSLPYIATQLSMFMTNLTPFINGARMIDSTVLTGIGYLSGAVALLCAAQLITSITSFLTLGGSFSQLGTQLSAFILNAMPFIIAMKTIDPSYLEGVKNLAEAIIIITAANILERATSWLTGGNSIAEFGAQLAQLGTYLNIFATNLGSFGEDKVAAVTGAANAIKAMAQAASEIPNQGGWLAAIVGDNTISSFGAQLPLLGIYLANFVKNLGTFTEAQVSTIECAANAIKKMAQAASELPNEGGWAAAILGDNSISTFSAKLPKLGTNLSKFAKNLGTFTDAQVSTVGCAANAIQKIASAADKLPNEGGWAAKIFGDNSISKFAKKLPSLGKNLKSFTDNLGSYGEDKVATVNASVKGITALSKLAKADLGDAAEDLPNFGKKLSGFAKSIKTFCSNMPSPESLTISVSNISMIIKAIDDISGKDAKVLSNFSNSLKKVGKEGVKSFVTAFTSDSARTNVKSAGVKLINKVIEGMESKRPSIKSKAKSIADSGANAAKEKKSSFKSAGKDLGNGLVEGIEAKKQAAYDAGYALGQKAVQGEKDGQKSNSPSKLTIKAGKWMGEGLVIGMEKMFSAVYNTGYGLGEGATNSISSAISRIGDIMSTDMDAEPTIRPVLDLSNVTSGVGAISSMLDMDPTIGVLSGARSISSMINNSQNGTFDDVVDAVDRLGRALNNLPSGDTVYVDGITYDDGSNISNAIKDIVRAARIERRV